MSGIIEFFGEVRSELRKVNWPTQEEVTKMTIIVIIATVVIGAYVGALDYALTKMIEAAV